MEWSGVSTPSRPAISNVTPADTDVITSSVIDVDKSNETSALHNSLVRDNYYTVDVRLFIA